MPTIAKAAEQIRAGEITPLELVELCLARIDQFEDRVHAWVMIDAEGAREEARRQTEMLDAGTDPGSLCGIPIGIKDIIDVDGWPTKAGSPLRETHIASRDAPIVASLRNAGAIILGKTVTTQFACFDPPPTRNPWNRYHTPGGSSSGSAAAVSLEMCMAAIGTQTGGSIIRPASYCGVAGLKPTLAAVSLNGVVPVSQTLDHAGPITRCVSDLMSVFIEICNLPARWRLDHTKDSSGVHSSEPFGFEKLGSEPPPRRFHVIESYFMKQADPEVRSQTRAALAKVQDAWAEEQVIELPASFTNVRANHYRIMAFEAARYHRADYSAHQSEYAPNVSKLINDGFDVSRQEYCNALEHRRVFQAETDMALAGGLIAVMPSTNTTAPDDLETTGDPRFNSPWSYAGVPSVTVPCGLASNGMPCGLQLVGAQNSEARLLQAAAWCEERIGFQDRPSLLTE